MGVFSFRLTAARLPAPGSMLPLSSRPFQKRWCVSDSCRLLWIPILSPPSPQLLSPSSAASMTSSRTTTPATIRRRPSRCLSGARRSTTAEAASWGARWGQQMNISARPLRQPPNRLGCSRPMKREVQGWAAATAPECVNDSIFQGVER